MFICIALFGEVAASSTSSVERAASSSEATSTASPRVWLKHLLLSCCQKHLLLHGLQHQHILVLLILIHRSHASAFASADNRHEWIHLMAPASAHSRQIFALLKHRQLPALE